MEDNMKKILIAGAGHGGLALAAILAEKGYSISVFEQKKREDLGYDWHDTFSRSTFSYANIAEYDKNDHHYRKQFSFFSSSLSTCISFDIPPEEQEWEMDRKILYDYLIKNAEQKGAKIFYNKTVNSAIIEQGKVTGLLVDGKPIKADLVVDSSGVSSPVIASLPTNYDMQPKYGKNDLFYAYRAYYNLVENAPIINEDRYNVYFKFRKLNGLAWFKITDNTADILIGSVDKLSMNDVEKWLELLRQAQPSVGKKIVRGGQIGDIPVRSTQTKLVGDNFAAVGDVASMTIPLNGSGIANSIRAGQLLADTIIKINNEKKDYSTENLWDYQVKYYLDRGAEMLSIAIIKNQILNYRPQDIDFLFDNKIISQKELIAGSMGQDIIMTPKELIDKIKKGFKHPIVMLRLNNAVIKSAKAKQIAKEIPTVYDEKQVKKWRNKIEKFEKS